MLRNPNQKERKIIIGIHGLSNKPPKKLLAKWWRKSIREGLAQNKHYHRHFRFRMVYWADVIYEKPQDPTIKSKEHARHLDEPYVPMQNAIKKSKGSWMRELFVRGEWLVDSLFMSKNSFINLNFLTDQILRIKYHDLDVYYKEEILNDKLDSERHARESIRRRLRDLLIRYKGQKIMLVAHSMGSIIAYDVLYAMQDEIEIDTLVTIGSPLGLPMVITKFFDEHKIPYDTTTKRPTPNSIRKSWFNLSDIDDGIAANDDLSDEFLRNKYGVRPVDQNVYNDYKNWITENAHKSFGYLRTLEMSNIVYDFLGKLPFWKKYKL